MKFSAAADSGVFQWSSSLFLTVEVPEIMEPGLANLPLFSVHEEYYFEDQDGVAEGVIIPSLV